jgi:hypothetical protein
MRKQQGAFFRRVMGALAPFFALFLTIVPVAAADFCPNPMRGGIVAGRYDFEYQSWIEDRNPGALLWKCVRNRSASLSLFVDWDGLKTFVAINEVSYIRNPIPGLKQRAVTLPLWYGAGPMRADVDTVVPDEQALLDAPLGLTEPVRRTAGWLFAQAPGVSPLLFPKALFSYSQISVPVGAFGPNVTLNDIVKHVESNPGILRTFQMAFESEPLVDESGKVTGIRDKCTYSITGRGKEKKWLSLRFSDETLQMEVFGLPRPHPLSQDQWTPTGPGKAMASSAGTRDLVNVGMDQLRRRQADMEVVSSNGGSVLASVPIVYYSDVAPRP